MEAFVLGVLETCRRFRISDLAGNWELRVQTPPRINHDQAGMAAVQDLQHLIDGCVEVLNVGDSQIKLPEYGSFKVVGHNPGPLGTRPTSGDVRLITQTLHSLIRATVLGVGINNPNQLFPTAVEFMLATTCATFGRIIEVSVAVPEKHAIPNVRLGDDIASYLTAACAWYQGLYPGIMGKPIQDKRAYTFTADCYRPVGACRLSEGMVRIISDAGQDLPNTESFCEALRATYDDLLLRHPWLRAR